jgi:hypothetical protein
MGTLPPLVFLVNLAVTIVLTIYSLLNLRLDLPLAAPAHPATYHRAILYVTFLLPTVTSTAYLWPVSRWLRTAWAKRAERENIDVPAAIARRAANAPVALTTFSLLSWILVDAVVLPRLLTIPAELSLDGSLTCAS